MLGFVAVFIPLDGGGNLDGLHPEPEMISTNVFIEAMNDDFNTPEASAVLFDLSREYYNKQEDPERADELALKLVKLGEILGILQRDPEVFLQGAHDDEDFEAEEIHELIVERNRARMASDFARSDEIP
ncbi:MAG: DALR domain-containing protein [Patescibacteria group bacterium]|nr:DALR domain-containing protein [Patescibacteria group bacterium]